MSVRLVALVVALTLAGVPVAGSRSAPVESAASLPTVGSLVFGCQGCPAVEYGLHTVSANGRNFRFLNGTDGGYDPRWSPDGRMLAFAAPHNVHSPDPVARLWLSRSDGSHRRLLARVGGSPVWSPRGDRLVFSRADGLYAINVKTRRARRLLRFSRTVQPFAAFDWSRDGQRIIGWRGAEVRRLWVVDADGSHLRRIGPRSLRGDQPRWSPDRRRIAYVDFEAGAIRILTLGTRRVRTIFAGAIEGDQSWAIAWSPDGRRLAVAGWIEYEPCDNPISTCQKPGLWIVNVTDARAKLVLTFPDDYAFIEGLDWKRG